MVEEVHKECSKIVLQISHAGARALAQLKDNEPFGPSSLKIKDVMNYREITTSEILKMTEDFKMAAVRAKKAVLMGFNFMRLMDIYLASSFHYFLIEEKINLEEALKIGLALFWKFFRLSGRN